jgi:hypothetical protein
LSTRDLPAAIDAELEEEENQGTGRLYSYLLANVTHSSGKGYMPDRARYLVARFPQHEELIVRLLDEHPKFRDLCHDYETVAAAIERWSTSREKDFLSEMREFRLLFQRLEQSIEQLLHEHRKKP